MNLHTCWLLGRQEAVTCIPDAGPVFEALLTDNSPNIDILSPLGMLLVNQRDQEHDDDLEEFFCNNPAPESSGGPGPEQIPSNTERDMRNAQTSLPYTHNGDLEDVIAEELLRNNVDSAVTVQGHKTSKAKALRH